MIDGAVDGVGGISSSNILDTVDVDGVMIRLAEIHTSTAGSYYELPPAVKDEVTIQ